jgi:hypothetical protein
MRLRLLIFVLLAASLLVTQPAEACQQCKRYWDYQSDKWCFYCLHDSYCGYFQCEIVEYSGTDFCGGTWDDEGECFTKEGSIKGLCGPIEMTLRENSDPRIESARWLLVKAEVKPSMRRSTQPRG